MSEPLSKDELESEVVKAVGKLFDALDDCELAGAYDIDASLQLIRAARDFRASVILVNGGHR